MPEEEQSAFSKAVLEQVSTAEPPKQDEPPQPPAEPPPPEKDTTQPPEKSEKDDPPAKDPNDEPPAGLSETQTANWKAFRQSHKELEEKYKTSEATRTDLASQLEALQTELDKTRQTFDLEAHTKLKDQVEDLKNQLTEVDILRSPEVKQAQDAVTAELDNAEKAIRRSLPEAEGIRRILQMTPESRERELHNLLENASASVTSRVWQVVDRLDSAERNVEQMTQSAQSKVEEWKVGREQQAATARQEEAKRANALFLQGLQAAQDSETGFPDWFTEKDGEDDHNKLVRESVNTARSILTESHSEEQMAQIAFLAGVGKTAAVRQQVMQQALAASEAERAELKSKLEALEAATPGGGGSGDGGDGAPTTPKSFSESVLSQMAG